jgi:carbamoyl-phosphate synthase large subunit
MGYNNILITAISGDVGNGVLKCLQNTKYELFGCDVYDYPVGMDKVRKCFKVPFARDHDYVDRLLNICCVNNIKTIVPVNEEELYKLDKFRDVFYKRNINLMLQHTEVLERCMDKYNLSKFLSLNNITVPETFLPGEFVSDGRKYIIKLRKSSGSKLIRIFENKGEIEETLMKDKNKYVIQEYIPSDENEYTVGVFSDGKSIRSLVFRRKLLNGYTNFVELVEDHSISKLAEAVADIFKLKGCINIQLRKYDNKNFIFEINPRISGTVFFRHMLGFTDVSWWLQYLNGELIAEYKLLYNKAIGVRELAEKYLLLEHTPPPPPSNL